MKQTITLSQVSNKWMSTLSNPKMMGTLPVEDTTRTCVQNMKYEITGSDVTKIEPVNGVLYVGGIIRTHTQLIRINWELDGSPGESVCRADYGQYEIDCLVQAGCKILSVEIY